MENLQLVISVASFVLNTVLFSGFIIPQVQKLKEIKDKLTKFKFTYVPVFGSMPANKSELDDKQKEEIESIQAIIDIYDIRSSELNPLIKLFYASIAAVFVSVVLIFVVNDAELCIKSSCVSWSAIITVLHLLVQLTILVKAINTYAVNPNNLRDISYLVQNMDINPHSLVNALGLSMSINSEKGILDRTNRDEPQTINLETQIRVYGYRFLLIVWNEEKNTFFTSFGPITQKTKGIWRHILPPNVLSSREEYNRIELGKFEFNLIEKPSDLKLTLLIFLPYKSNQEFPPMIGEARHEVYGIDSERYTSSSSLGMWQIESIVTYDKITCSGVGAELEEIEYSGDAKDTNDKVLKAAIDKYKNELINCTEVKQYSSREGDLVTIDEE